MTKQSRAELTLEHGKRFVDQPLSVWSASYKAVVRDVMISGMVVKSKCPSEAWKVLNSMVEGENGDHAKDNAKKNFETLAMIVGESDRECLG